MNFTWENILVLFVVVSVLYLKRIFFHFKVKRERRLSIPNLDTSIVKVFFISFMKRQNKAERIGYQI